MSRQSDVKREKEVMRHLRRLYWRAQTKYKRYFWPVVLIQPPFFFVMNVYTPLLMAYGLEAVIERDVDAAWSYGLQIVAIAAVSNILFFYATWAFNRNGTKGGEYLQYELFDNFLSKDYSFYADNYIGALGAQANNLREAFNDYNFLTMFAMVKNATIVLAGLGVLAYFSPLLAGMTALCMLLVLGFTIGTSSYRLRYRRKVSEASSKIAAMTGDVFSHADTVKGFANEAYERERLTGPVNAWQKALLKSWDFMMPINFGRNLLLALTMAALLVGSAILYSNGTISIAIVIMVQLYVVRLVSTTLEIADIIKLYDAVMGRAYQASATMLVRPTILDPEKPEELPQNREFNIHVDSVSYKYPEADETDHAVTNFSLDIQHGEKLGVVGYSGSGKTTLSKLLLRFMDVERGSIALGGVDLRDLRQSDLRQVVSYVPQEPTLFHRSIRENIAYARPDASDAEVLEAARLANVDDFAEKLPNRYDTMVGERGVKLSGGQRQRVAIARAILKASPILVLDEATSALDSASEKLIQEALWRLFEGKTAVVIAHRLSTIQRMDRIIVMDNGKLVEQGTHDELLEYGGIYAKLWSHQSGGYLVES